MKDFLKDLMKLYVDIFLFILKFDRIYYSRQNHHYMVLY